MSASVQMYLDLTATQNVSTMTTKQIREARLARGECPIHGKTPGMTPADSTLDKLPAFSTYITVACSRCLKLGIPTIGIYRDEEDGTITCKLSNKRAWNRAVREWEANGRSFWRRNAEWEIIRNERVNGQLDVRLSARRRNRVKRQSCGKGRVPTSLNQANNPEED